MSIEKKLHLWGFNDTYFEINKNKNTIQLSGNRYLVCGYEMPYFLDFLKSELELCDNDLNEIQEIKKKIIPDSVINDNFIELINKLNNRFIHTMDDDIRLSHSHGQTSASEIYNVIYDGEGITRVVDMVIYPTSEDQIKFIIDCATKTNVCLVPYGGGTNVSCALQCKDNEKRMIISIDMEKMNKLISIDKHNYLATFQCGITGKEMETILEKHGYVSGHEPDSYEFSTLGGWISTNASGMKRSKYGNIEDIVVNYRMITSTGILTKKIQVPRKSNGSGLDSLIFGSEGNYGIITEATIKIHQKPETSEYDSIIFKDFSTGVQFLKNLATKNGELMPSSIRLVDNKQFRFALALKPEKTYKKLITDKLKDIILDKYYGFQKNKMVLCTVTFEGKVQAIKEKKEKFKNLVYKYDGIFGGSDNGKKGYQLTFAIAYIRDFLSKLYIIGETFETSVPWTNVLDVCTSVEWELENKTRHYNSKPFLSYRVTQSYKNGACIYFMLGFYHKNIENVVQVFEELEKNLRNAILKAGGSISHHHGIGKHRSHFLIDPNDPVQDSIRNFKKNIDPQNIFGISNNIFDI